MRLLGWLKVLGCVTAAAARESAKENSTKPQLHGEGTAFPYDISFGVPECGCRLALRT
jgi:hypothetical protein